MLRIFNLLFVVSLPSTAFKLPTKEMAKWNIRLTQGYSIPTFMIWESEQSFKHETGARRSVSSLSLLLMTFGCFHSFISFIKQS